MSLGLYQGSKTMKKKFAVLFVFLGFYGFTFSQVKMSEKDDRTKFEENEASIFIKAECEQNQTLRFKLFNNTKWAIAVSTFSFYLTPNNVKRVTLQNGKAVYLLPNDKEISSLFFTTEKEQTLGKEKGLLLGGYGTDSYNTSWIGKVNPIVQTANSLF